MIKIDSITRKYNEFTAVDNISFDIPTGQIVGLLGHNGAGKTTLMKIITGFLEPNSGNITIDFKKIEDGIEYKKLIGYLPENSPNYGELTVGEYLNFSAELKDLSFDSVIVAVRKVGLDEKINQKISTLSKGFQQRVGVAQAILGNPKVLILDEPTNGLDPNQIEVMRNLIKDLSKDSTIIISTHIMQEVQAICDRIIILNRGAIKFDKLISDLKNEITINLSGNLDLLNEICQKLSINFEKISDELIKFYINNKDLISVIIRNLIDNNFKIYAVSDSHNNLEKIFKEVTTK